MTTRPTPGITSEWDPKSEIGEGEISEELPLRDQFAEVGELLGKECGPRDREVASNRHEVSLAIP